MERESKFNWKIRIATLSIFLLGFVAGVLALNAYNVWSNAALSNTRQPRYERMLDQVKLSDEQKAGVQKVMSETRDEFKNLPPNPQVGEIRNRADEKLKKIFTSRQWEEFQALRTTFYEKENTNTR